jgi:hypothetical protein
LYRDFNINSTSSDPKDEYIRERRGEGLLRNIKDTHPLWTQPADYWSIHDLEAIIRSSSSEEEWRKYDKNVTDYRRNLLIDLANKLGVSIQQAGRRSEYRLAMKDYILEYARLAYLNHRFRQEGLPK